MRCTFIRSIVAAGCLAVWLTGCSAGPLGGSLPESLGGLPADTPPPPKTPYKFPAVHDMPPPRATPPLTDKQQWEIERDLTRLRKKQETREAADGDSGQKPAKRSKKSSRKGGKKTPANSRGHESAGAQASP